ncbi:pyridoxal phosphate-dependent aminotransferase [Leisingera sp. ANG-Vp]|uniref:pyridoxal phosphate-dependent aminotransferase n=1 Tax=Leisingera sp. ANG-Vp TaxID=1577896 RepID=UPI00057DC82A|nr:pyridoxal phosphate-dependent aminotransferase [Leisingera sp. ANG-Vp]KIC21293.1 aspartate aminotransferase [Leisingera sp. ANG-Vp]
MTMLAKRMAQVKPSPSMAVSQAAKALVAQGVEVADLGLGEPDFNTPDHIIAAAHTAAMEGDTRYTATGGAPATKEAVIEKFRRENGLEFAAEEIVVANGAKQIIFNALMATLEEGDEVILPAPYFVSYPDMALMLGGKPVVVECCRADGFKLTPEALQAAITPRSKWLILNMPGNPSGAVYSEAELQALGAVLADHPDLLILSDEIYEHILFDGLEFVSFGKACPGLRDRTLIVNGVSKAYAMTGWRIGYGAGPAELIKGMTTVQSQSTTNACSIAQAATVAALTGPQGGVARFREAFERRRDLVVEGINSIEGLELDAPQGAFYAYIDCAGIMGKTTHCGVLLEDDTQVTQFLLDEARVAAVPGSAYGLSPFFRLSTATSGDVLTAAINRIADAVAKLA